MHEHVTDLLTRCAKSIDRALVNFLSCAEGAPPRLIEAMRYSIEAGGKRLRPALVLECCAMCGGDDDAAMPAAVAIECVHTFSLIHDDLPAMDNDDLRRGKPTNHKMYGEAMAILAGDALLTLAFELLSHHIRDPEMSRQMTLTLARATGRAGMIGGQVLDMEAESRKPGHGGQAAAESRNELECVQRIHSLKTAKLIAAACRMGGIAAGAASRQLESLEGYGEKLGLAFQAVDDLLDVRGSDTTLGKTAGKDAASGKQTLVSVVGEQEGWRIAVSLAAEAVEQLHSFGPSARPLIELARFVVERNS